MAYPHTPAEVQALTNTSIRPIYDAMQLSYPSLLPERPSSGKGNYFTHLKQALLQAILSPSFAPPNTVPITNPSTSAGVIDQGNVSALVIPNAEALIVLLKLQGEELAEQQRISKEIEQKDLYQVYLQNESQLKAGKDLIKKRQDELLLRIMAARIPQEETPAVNSAPPLWVNALNLKIDNFLKKSADQVSDDIYSCPPNPIL